MARRSQTRTLPADRGQKETTQNETPTYLVVHARGDDPTELPELGPEVCVRLHRPLVQVVVIF